MPSAPHHPHRLAITMGCPAGIGPEIIVKYFAQFEGHDGGGVLPVILGDMGVLRRCAAEMQAPVHFYSWHPETPGRSGQVPVLELSHLRPEELVWGQPSISTGKAMALYIEKAVQLLLDGSFAAMVTCPISKQSLHDAGYSFPGHTEMLAALTQMDEPVMMLAGDRLRVTLATIHCPLASVPSALNQEGLTRLIRVTGNALRDDFQIATPRLAVAALNPHAGEGGLFGLEEEKIILPVIRSLQLGGLCVEGPFPPDTIFLKAASGAYDAVVCMYHDQGLIPFKLLHFQDGVNVTLGLPIIRTSVDHGTAYDIAGKGLADPSSLIAAVRLASCIAHNRSASTSSHFSSAG